MDSRISSLKKIIRVFRKYGIVILGKRKFDDFYHDLYMDKIYVNGLIFEVEYALRKEISDEYITSVSTPLALVNAFLKVSNPSIG